MLDSGASNMYFIAQLKGSHGHQNPKLFQDSSFQKNLLHK